MLSAQACLLLAFALTGSVNIFLLWRCARAGNTLLIEPNSICRRTKRPGGLYAKLCQTQPEIAREVAKGARLGTRECQHQFRYQRWNCTSHRKSLSKILQQDIRETAFVNSITAAGVLHAVTQACSQGAVLQCGCVALKGSAEWPLTQDGRFSIQEDQRWEWAGCGDDVDFGHHMSRRFMDSRRRKGTNDIKTLIDLHNSEAGRLATTSCRVSTHQSA